MKKYIILVLWFISFSSNAENLALNFRAIPLVAFAQATYKEMMNRDFVMSPELVAMEKPITIFIKNIRSEDLPKFVEGVLNQQGVKSVLKNGVYYLDVDKFEAGIKSNFFSSSVTPSLTAPGPFGFSGQGSNMPYQSPCVGDCFASNIRSPEDESNIFIPLNRSREFVALVIGSAFGKQSVIVAGAQIVFVGSKLQIEKMRVLALALDVPTRLVDVSASWVEVTHTEGSGRGISLLANVLGAKLGVSLGSVTSGSAVSLKNTNFQIVIDALNTDGRFHQVSNSRVSGDEDEKISLSVGDETPTVSGASRDNFGNLIQAVVYRPSGVIVDVLPKVLGNGKINMLVDGQISSFKQTVNGVSGSPTLIKRQVKTTVTVGDGEVLLIGGLNSSEKVNTVSGLSFLPSSWSVKNDSLASTDLVLVLSASVVK